MHTASGIDRNISRRPSPRTKVPKSRLQTNTAFFAYVKMPREWPASIISEHSFRPGRLAA
jgi:hypothetical protein